MPRPPCSSGPRRRARRCGALPAVRPSGSPDRRPEIRWSSSRVVAAHVSRRPACSKPSECLGRGDLSPARGGAPGDGRARARGACARARRGSRGDRPHASARSSDATAASRSSRAARSRPRQRAAVARVQRYELSAARSSSQSTSAAASSSLPTPISASPRSSWKRSQLGSTKPAAAATAAACSRWTSAPPGSSQRERRGSRGRRGVAGGCGGFPSPRRMRTPSAASSRAASSCPRWAATKARG